MKRSLNKKQELIAYLLNKDADLGNHSTKKIGKLFGVSQSTAYNAVQRVQNQKRITDLQSELVATKKELMLLNPNPFDAPIKIK